MSGLAGAPLLSGMILRPAGGMGHALSPGVSAMRVLLVEDEPSAAAMLAKALREQSYAVDVARTAREAEYLFSLAEYDAVLLDVGLPDLDGFSFCGRIRSSGSIVPVIMLTARDAIESRIAGLDTGADDYIVKPFDLGELFARIRAAIRRGGRPMTPSVLVMRDLEIDRRERQVRRAGRPILLTAREYALLEYLALHAGEVVGRAAIAEHVWDATHEAASNVIDVCVQRLRRKIDLPGQESLIVTRRSEGYMFTIAPTHAAPPT
jgi:two-component system copper resistance phosphate regulon response regulator CusR